tara:strand:- start:80 stop:1498 length:1419 start_codon:yes stop_codon:yes gene_type:complete
MARPSLGSQGDAERAAIANGNTSSMNYASSTPPASVRADFQKYFEETGRRAYKPAVAANPGRGGSSGTAADYGGSANRAFREWATTRTVKPEDSFTLKHAAFRKVYPYSFAGIRAGGWESVDGYDKFVTDTQEALDALDPDDNRYEDANPGVGTGDTGFGNTGNGGGSGGFTEQELIDAATDPTKTIVRDADGNVVSIDDAVDPGTVTLDGSEAIDELGDSLEDIFDGPSDGPPSDAPVLGGTLNEITNGTDTGTNVEEPITTVEEPITTIDENGAGGTLNEVASPGFEIIGNVIYDADGNIIGTTGETAPGIAPVVGGDSPTNPVFDEITAEQQFELDQQAEAVALLDSGKGRYDAAVRKMGIIGRQGEEYAPLILDQLRMAEQEAAQPQFAAFGFGQNNMLGGMPQIGVQGVQGNVGGQSALSALSNAGLNQLNVGRQNYNRIALPSVGSDGMPISQINNPTIFKASTNV